MEDFRALGKPMNQPSKALDTFPSPAHVRRVRFTSDEVTSFCPVTGQPDFNTVEIEFEPDQFCVESKSLKLYLWTFREEHVFGETLAHTIASDLFDALQPHAVWVKVIQNIRGGLQMTAFAERNRKDESSDE